MDCAENRLTNPLLFVSYQTADRSLFMNTLTQTDRTPSDRRRSPWGIATRARSAFFALGLILAATAWGRDNSGSPAGLIDLSGVTVTAAPVGPPVPLAEPVITRIVTEDSDIVITVQVPAGKWRVTLECRSRIGPGSWIPEARQNVEGFSTEVHFRLPNRRNLELLRVRAESPEDLPLPAAFYSGKSHFDGILVTNNAALRSTELPPGIGLGNVVVTDVSGTATGPTSTVSAPRTVAESDIWRIDSNTVYFFNQGRGLQVIDITDPDAPRLRGELPVAAYGEQMYLLPTTGPSGERHVALLLASNCSDGGAVWVVQVASNGQMSVVHQLPFAGQLRESRLVGSALYIASYWWHTVPTSENPSNGGTTVASTAWQSDTVVTSYHLGDLTSPGLTPETLIFPANPTAISATDRLLFVALRGADQYDPATGISTPGTPTVEVIDISDPAGRLLRRGSLVTRGVVEDKFKLSLQGEVLRVASFIPTQGRPWTFTNWISLATGRIVTVTTAAPGQAHNAPPTPPENYKQQIFTQWVWAPVQTWLETYSLSDAGAPAKLGELLLKENEQLFATRFAGDRAYLVTFRRIDPLFIVDLSDPTRPAIRGELQVPGYSTYLSPLSDSRLLAMGLENGQPIVSLFDVGDVTRPKLISKVDMKAANGWGYSEANNDEKAFNYSAESGLILFPWQGWADGQSFQTIQLIDLRNDVLTRRGVIDHAVPARRAAVVADRVLSLSARELLSVDISDRDRPVVTSELPLQYQVDRVWVLDDRLLQLGYESISNGLFTRATLKLAHASSPDRPTGLLTLAPGLTPLGLELRDRHLHVLQQAPTTYRTEPQIATNAVGEWVVHREARIKTNISTTIYPETKIVSWTTNFTTAFVPQPPARPIVGTNEQVVSFTLPLFPQLVPYQTNIQCPPDLALPCTTNVLTSIDWIQLPPLIRTNRTYVYGPEVPQPDLLVTNELIETHVTLVPGRIVTNSITVVTNWYPLPPVWETRLVVVTNEVSIAVPGFLLASTIDCSGPAPQFLGQSRSDAPVIFRRNQLMALWPATHQLVWTDAGQDGYFGYPISLVDDFVVGPVGISIGWPGRGGPFWGGWYQDSSVAHFLPVEMDDYKRPAIGKPLAMGESLDWSSIHTAFAAEGRIFFSHETRTTLPDLSVPDAPKATTGALLDIALPPSWLQRWESHYFLDVLDLTDPEEVRIRQPLPLPGPLTGISHAGALLYTQGLDATGASANALQALSYDGLAVALVDTLPVPFESMALRPDGVAVVAQPAGTNTPAAIDSWALGTDAKWHRYTSVSLETRPALSLHAYPDGLIVAERGAGEFLFLKSAGPSLLTPLGIGAGQCGLFPDWNNSDASLSAGLWLARGPLGVWRIRPESVPLSP